MTPALRRDRSSPSPLVLIVEHDADTREMYGEFLEQYGFKVAHAQSGVEALTLAQSLKPDVITTDIGLHGAIDGCELTAILKSSPDTQRIPVVAVSGWATQTHVDRARHSKCDAVLVKPCLPQELLATIQRLLITHPRPAAAPDTAPPPTQPIARDPEIVRRLVTSDVVLAEATQLEQRAGHDTVQRKLTRIRASVVNALTDLLSPRDVLTSGVLSVFDKAIVSARTDIAGIRRLLDEYGADAAWRR